MKNEEINAKKKVQERLKKIDLQNMAEKHGDFHRNPSSISHPRS
jgi:hypothetical protein